MKVLYVKALVKDLEAVTRNLGVRKRLLKLIEMLKTIDSLSELQNIKKIKGYDNYYPGGRDVASLLSYRVVRRQPFKKAADGKNELPIGVRVTSSRINNDQRLRMNSSTVSQCPLISDSARWGKCLCSNGIWGSVT